MAKRRGKVEAVTDFFLSSKISLDGDCSHEIKKHLLLGRKAMTNLESVLKSRDITLLTKVCILKAMVFPVIMYRCENWTIKKAEHWKVDAFKLWCWRRLLRVPRTARRSNQSILKEISPEYSLEGLKLKLHYFGHLIWRANFWTRPWCWERLKTEKGVTEDRWLDGIADNGPEFEQTLGDSERLGSLVCCSTWGRKESDMTEWLNNNNEYLLTNLS